MIAAVTIAMIVMMGLTYLRNRFNTRRNEMITKEERFDLHDN